jgi:hypothetical protein
MRVLVRFAVHEVGHFPKRLVTPTQLSLEFANDGRHVHTSPRLGGAALARRCVRITGQFWFVIGITEQKGFVKKITGTARRRREPQTEFQPKPRSSVMTSKAAATMEQIRELTQNEIDLVTGGAMLFEETLMSLRARP